MHQETRKKDDITYHLCFFDDWLDFVSLAERVERERVDDEFGGLSCASLEEGKEGWSGTKTLSDAIRLARRGWPEGVVRIQEIIPRISRSRLYSHSQRIVRHLDCTGDEPDVELFLAGEPEHMATLQEQKRASRGKIVRILLSRSGLSRVESGTMVRRGVAIMLAFEVMRLLGYSPELSICLSCEERGHQIEQYVPVLHAGDPVNTDTLAFMFQHPAVLRRLSFAAKECEPAKLREQMGFHANGGYGSSCAPVFQPESDLFIDWDDGLLLSDKEIERYALEVLRRVGIDMDLDEAAA